MDMVWYKNKNILFKLFISIAISVIYLSGLLKPLDNFIMDSKFRLISEAPSKTLTFVEIDAKSLKAINNWPWSREHHAKLVDKLIETGANKIAFDIDFSSHSNEIADQAFETSLSKSQNRVILPSLRQFQNENNQQTIVENAPLERFLQYTDTANVNVFPDESGTVREFYIGSSYNDKLRLSLVSLLSGQSYFDKTSFLIDYSIDITQIDRISFIDILNANFDINQIKGKNIIVGASALELSDNFSVPRYGVLPGALLQQLAYESIVQDREISTVSPYIIILINFAFMFMVIKLERLHWQNAVKIYASVIGATFITSLLIQKFVPYNVEIVVWALTISIGFLQDQFSELEHRAFLIVKERMINNMQNEMITQMIRDNFDGIIITDRDGRVKTSNVKVRDILLLSRAVPIGSSVFDYIPDIMEETIKLSDTENNSRKHHIVGLEREIFSEDDSKSSIIELTISRSEVRSNIVKKFNFIEAHEFLSFTFRDITKRKEAEENERRIKEELIEASQAKTEFLSNMSHELRTPLNAIIGFSEIIQHQMFGQIGEEKYIHYAKDINDSGQHLLNIVSDILEVSKIESGEVTLNETDINIEECIKSCIASMSDWKMTENKPLKTDIDAFDFHYKADLKMVEQIIINILSNAFKFSEENSPISLKAYNDEDKGIIIEIKDNGIGISQENVNHITEAFFQVESAFSRNFYGTGLGLFLTSKFVALHGGTLNINSTLNEGTIVELILPKERISYTLKNEYIPAQNAS